MTWLVSGEIASGKSTLIRALLQRWPCYTVWSVDEEVRRLHAEPPTRCLLETAFGTADRAQLFSRVFREAGLWDAIDTLLRPELSRRLAAALAQENVIIEYPAAYGLDIPWAQITQWTALHCTPEVRRARLMQRPRLDVAKVDMILARPTPPIRASRAPDHIVDTSTQPPEVLIARIRQPGGNTLSRR